MLLRVQCYEGLDVAQTAYEWNVARQMMEIRLAEAAHDVGDAAARERLAQEPLLRASMLIERPLLQALTQARSPVLLIDELDRADEPFDAFLLEVLAENQLTIPELGTVNAPSAPPIVVITSNRTREIHDALKRRCLYHWVDYPDVERELEIVRLPRAGRAGAARRPGRRVRAADAHARPVQGAGHRRDDRLDQRAGRARTRSASIPTTCTTRSACCSSTATTSPRCRAATSPGCSPSCRRRRAATPAARRSRPMLADNVVHFARVLRRAGMPVGPDRVLAALEAIEAVGLGRRDDVHAALSAVMLDRHEQQALFDDAFAAFWRDPKLLEQMMAELLPKISGRGDRADKPRANRLADALAPRRAADAAEPAQRAATSRSSSRPASRSRTASACSAPTSSR